jgi:hypothetical protein
MIAGKQDPDLASVSLVLPAPPPKAVKRRQLHHLPPPTPNEDTDCTPDDLERYQETGEMRLSIFAERLDEYKKLDEWITRWNAGLSCSPQPPQGKYYHLERPLPPPPPPPPPPSPTQSFAFSHPDYPDPADDVEPDNPKDDDYEPTPSTSSPSDTAFAGHLGASPLSFLRKLKKQSEDAAWSEAKMMTTDDDEDQ